MNIVDYIRSSSGNIVLTCQQSVDWNAIVAGLAGGLVAVIQTEKSKKKSKKRCMERIARML